MNTLTKLTFTIILFCCVTFTTFAQQKPSVDPAKKQDIQKLLKLTGSGDLAKQMMKQMLSNFKMNMTNVPEKFWQDFEKKADMNELMEQIIPIYDKHLNHEDIKGLVKFYETPLGKKVVTTLPSIMQESMMAGQQWGMKIGQQIAKELEAKGYKK